MINNLTNTQKKTITKTDLLNSGALQYYDMIVFCHLRWQFVYQRPQHIISRLASNMKVLFIEEPIHNHQDDTTSGNLMVITEKLHVLQPYTKDIESIIDVLPAYIKNKTIPVGWFYSASFSPLLEQINFETIVYDCMDELSLFKDAPVHLINQEKYLMAHADIVFTGGKSLYESKKQLHSNVYCFPSSVDEAHFAQALNGISAAADIASLPKPIVGYYGVIDERIDLDLLHQCAKKLPDVSFVMIGPLAKIEDADLPKENNIHYLGMKSYNELPNYLKAFDIAMMPFALNDATKYISPTKTLEYMAAGKPIISTKITDVVRDYSDSVTLIENDGEFCDAIETLLSKNRLEMEMEYNKILEKTSWNSTADKMESIIKKFAK
ncbi:MULTISPECIES: glycosyltransferase [unclassified Flavobacterium]|uniref:glycosyltransferase n=1 Tax=unclassified Flavobacterium TaxID=196869 RepID=UPI001060220F|nr:MULTISPECIES: glycosyltransferase [unclassified Flavobacterium]TDP00258.1 glycosyltransferase involved in cell wall biosynthesis [Flavobacterium sp. 245]TDW52135.1 glycosyltransferase involved in cell wall biosynthesis [Flavobacterium sp. 270]